MPFYILDSLNCFLFFYFFSDHCWYPADWYLDKETVATLPGKRVKIKLSPSGTNPSLYLLLFYIFFVCVLIFPVPLQLPAATCNCTDNPQKWHVFLLLPALPATMMHCPSVHFNSALLRVIALSGVTMLSKSLKMQPYSATHSPSFSWLEEQEDWVAQWLCSEMLAPPWGIFTSDPILFYSWECTKFTTLKAVRIFYF